MIDIKSQEGLFNKIGDILQTKIIAYAIGGTAMMLRGFKGLTFDIDLVFENESDRGSFIETLEKLEFKKDERRVIETYGLKKNTPMMLRLASEQFIFDLFVNKIASSVFSDGMKERANEIHEFGKNLVIKAADTGDILIMKSVTGRTKDQDDIISTLNDNGFDWDKVVEEAETQVRLGNEAAILGLGERLEKLENNKAIILPKGVLDRLFKSLKKQVNKNGKKKR